MADIDEILMGAEERMEKAVTALKDNFAGVRTGRANAMVLDRIKVDYYGVPTPVNQMAGVKTPEAHLLVIEPWDKGVLRAIEQAILESDLGVTPNNDGNVIRLPFPSLTEERQEKRDQLKQRALDKTPEKLRNPSDLQVRFRTGAVYTAVTIVCVLAGNIPMLLMIMAVAGICAGEFFYMLRSDAKLPNEMLGIIAAVLYPPSVYLGGLIGAMLVSLALLLALLVWYVFWLKARIPDVGVSFFGAAYTGLLLCGLIVIRASLPAPWGGVVVLLLFPSVWANDAFAFLVGSKIGRHKLAPRTSPKKSWEGFFAGLVGSVLFWCAISFVPGVTMTLVQAIAFGVVAGCMGVLGDLAESRIKRNSGFKDSGTIMPGHGGLLDRSDSLFLTSITAAILMVAGGCIPYTLF